MFARLLVAAAAAAFSSNVFAVAVEDWAPDSVAAGETIGWFQARVSDDAGNGLAGVAYRFETDPACGAFAGASSVEGVTDELGVASAGSFTGLAVALSCATRVWVEGVAAPTDLSVHVFDPDRVVFTVTPAAVEAEVNQRYSFQVAASESGFPVNAVPLGGSASTAPSGATGTFVEAIVALNSGIARIVMLANGKPGKYEITLEYHSVRAVVPVTQRVSTGAR